MVTIIPTIFATSKKSFNERLKKLLPVSKNLQIDIMDGRFVGNKSVRISDISVLKRYNKNFEAHLMILHPEKYLNVLRSKGFKKIIFHYDAVADDHMVMAIAAMIHKLKMKAFLALNPETPISRLKPHLKVVDGVLLMGVHPGKEGQKLIPSIYSKIKTLRKLDKKIPIQIDGGVNFETSSRLARAGASVLNSGSLVANAEKPREAFRKLSKTAGI